MLVNADFYDTNSVITYNSYIEATRRFLICGGVQVERRVYEFEDLCKVLAACMKRALLDAKRGDERALLWLDRFYPEWRRFV